MEVTTESVAATKEHVLQLCNELEVAAIRGFFINSETMPSLILNEESFLQAVKAEKPKAVYWHELHFSLIEFIESELSALGWREEFDEDENCTRFPTLDQLRAQLCAPASAIAAYEGSTYSLCVMFPGAGANRVARFRTTWLYNIEDEIAELIEGHQKFARSSAKVALAGNGKALYPLALEIAQNAEFLSTRGLPKRYSIVAKLYQDRIPPHPDGRASRAVEHVPGADLNLELVTKMAQDIAREEAQTPQ